MNPRMQARRKKYLYRKNTFLFRLVSWVAVLVMIGQAVNLWYSSVTANDVYDIGFGTPQKEITQPVINELTKLKGFSGCYPIYTMEAEIEVGLFSAVVLLKGIDFASFPLKLGEVNQDIVNSNENLFIIGCSAFSSLNDKNDLTITKLQEEKLLQGWKEVIVTMNYGGEDSSNAGKMYGRIVGRLTKSSMNKYAQDIFVSEAVMRHMMEESGSRMTLEEGVLQIKGLAYAALAELILQEAGFTTNSEWEEMYKEYQGNMKQNGIILIIAGFFLALALLALKRMIFMQKTYNT